MQVIDHIERSLLMYDFDTFDNFQQIHSMNNSWEYLTRYKLSYKIVLSRFDWINIGYTDLEAVVFVNYFEYK